MSSPRARAESPPTSLPGHWRFHAFLLGMMSLFLTTKALSQETAQQSCSSIGCHGGVQDRGPNWNSSNSTYDLKDPHARAYQVLFSEASKQIVELYRPSIDDAPKDYTDFVNEHCANCHGSHDLKSPNVPSKSIGCGACHGSTDAPWVEDHVQGRSNRWSDVSWAGYNDMRNLTNRAKTCVACHVGTVGDEQEPERRVGHDLIASGHPALRFEFSSYLASLPAHWDQGRDSWFVDGRPGKAAGTFWRECWSIGKTTALNRAISLLEHDREESPGNAKSVDDFAHFDCFSCHHAIGSRLDKKSLNAKPKILSWHIAGIADPGGTVNTTESVKDLIQLRKLAERSSEVSARAATGTKARSWEQAAQNFLAYSACYRDFRDATKSWEGQQSPILKVEPATLKGYRDPLIRFARALRFSETGEWESPRWYSKALDADTNDVPEQLNALKNNAEAMIKTLRSQ